MSACRALTTEPKLGPYGWPNLIPMIQSIISESPTARFGKQLEGVSFSPLQKITNITTRRELLRVSTLHLESSKRFSKSRIRGEQVTVHR